MPAVDELTNAISSGDPALMRVAVASGASVVTRLVEIWLKEYLAPGQKDRESTIH